MSLEPPGGFGFPTRDNGLQRATLPAYDNPERFPNIAVLRVPVTTSEWLEPADDEVSILERFRMQRSVVDTTELFLEWLAFVWGRSRQQPAVRRPGCAVGRDGGGGPQRGPLRRYSGPGDRANCPEAIWQTGRW